MNTALSITFGECVETHAGMAQHGEIREHGFSCRDLESIWEKFEDSELHDLHNRLPKEHREGNEACLLIIRGGVKLLGLDPDSLYEEMVRLEPDKKAKMRGRVVNKLARWNLCFADFSQKADFESGKGTVIDFEDLPLLGELREKIGEFGIKDLFAELNVYYDMKANGAQRSGKCGIGYHGDTERRVVVCARLGQDNPIAFQWMHRSKPVGKRMLFHPKHGDIYIMSEKAVGTDWKKSSLFTLRHAAGSEKYIQQKEA